MRKTPKDSTPAPVAELIGDPIVQMLMRADNVTEHELTALIGTIAFSSAAVASRKVWRGKCHRVASTLEKTPVRPRFAN